MEALIKYWPTITEINNCIKAEAESSHESLLLAVHQPMSLSCQPINKPDDGKICNEQDLLKAFLTKNLDTGTLLVPITGKSGTGKSHAIRWLDAQLRRRDVSHKKFHIIKVPKSASLKSVLELILEPLHGPEYDQMRIDLKNATASITLDKAVIQFRAGLEMALKDYAQSLKNQLKNNAGERNILLPKIGHAGKLPDLLNDSYLRDHFDNNVLKRIIQRSVKGISVEELNDGNDDIPQFNKTDLDIPIELDIVKAAQKVQLYIQAKLSGEDSKNKAIEVLNDKLDEAIGNTFKLNENLGGKSLQEIILDIRKSLLAEGKELILLIEDFAALTGIQEPLLNICIQEAISNGKQSLCVMRTAMAVTDGFLIGRNTIATRAKSEWVVRSEFETDSQIYRNTQNIVGAYLNAGRHGEQAIRTYFKSPEASIDDLNSWIKPYTDDDLEVETEEILQAFGSSEQGFNLFPFNISSLNLLIDKILLEGGKLVYNPRTIINRILRDTLLNNRDIFENNQFPTSGFHGGKVRGDVAVHLSKTVQDAENNKYQSFLYFWGDNPETVDDLKSIDPKLYEAFSLKPVTDQFIPRPQSEDIKPEETDTLSEIPVLIQPERDVFSDKWNKILEDWVAGEPLGQNEAKLIRNAICESLVQYIDWGTYNLPKPSLKPKLLIWIPPENTRGNPKVTQFIKIAQDHNDTDGKIRKSILAILRHQKNKWSWNYDGGDEDSIYFANFLEQLTDELIEKQRKNANDELIPLAQSLLVANHIVGGATPVSTRSVVKLLQVILEEHEEPQKSGLNDNWDHLRSECYKIIPSLKCPFTDNCGYFQGIGKKVIGLNYNLLKDLFNEATFYGKIETDKLNLELRGILTREKKYELFSKLSPVRIKSLLRLIQDGLKDWHQTIDETIGSDFNKEEILSELKATIAVIKSQGDLWPQNFTPQSIGSLIKSFEEYSTGRIAKDISAIFDIEIDKDPFKMTSLLTRVDLRTKELVYRFATGIDALLKHVESTVNNRKEAFKDYDPGPVIADIENDFDELINSFSDISGGTNDFSK